jgi:hypothetical protein
MPTRIEREELLKTAIADHGDARYGDGVQVGAFARALLSAHYTETGRFEDASRTAEEMVKLFPGAVDRNGRKLVDGLRRMKILP